MNRLFLKYRSISLFTVSSVFLNFSGLITALVTYRWIEPYYIGIWQSLVLIEVYSTFIRLGVINGMNRELPFAMGQGNNELAIKYAETTLYFTWINIATVIILAPLTFLFINMDYDWIFPLIAVLIIVCVGFYNSYLMGTFRANADFDRLSYIQIVQGFIKLVTIILVYFGGFQGYIIREILMMATITLLAHWYRPMKTVKARFNKDIFFSLLKIGLPIFISGYIISFLNTVPRIFILNYGTVEQLGIYAPLLAVIAAIAVLPDSITTYFYPKMSHALGKTNDKLVLWKKALYAHFGLIIIGIPIAIFCYFVVPLVIDLFLPKYAEAKSIMGIGVFIAVFMGYKFGYTTLITLKDYNLIIIYLISFAILQLLLPLIFLQYLEVLPAIVYGQLFTSFLMVVVSLSTNYLATHKKNKVLI
jgi:O-antigen/teichoic acid export membrane protein